MAITRRTARRSEPCLNDLEEPSGVAPMLSARHSTSNSNMADIAGSALSTIGTSWISRRRHARESPTSALPTSSPTSTYSTISQHLLVPRAIHLKQIKAFLRSKNPRQVAIAVLLLIIVLWCFTSILILYLFGPHGSIKGGQLGYLVDQCTKDYVRYHTMSKWKEEIQKELHIPLVHSEQDGTLLEPRFWPFDVIIKTRPNVAVIEMLLREKSRILKVHEMVQSTAKTTSLCLKDSTSNIQIPKTFIQLERNMGDLDQLLPYWITRSLPFQVESIAIYKKDITTLPPIIDIKSCRNMLYDIDYYAISTEVDLHCLAFKLGGMRISGTVSTQQRSLVEHILQMTEGTSTQTTCTSKVGYAVLSNAPTPDLDLRKTSSIMSYTSTIYSSLPADHPASLCLPPFHDRMGISPYTEANLELSFQSIFTNRLITTISHERSNITSPVWGVATFQCDFMTNGLKCCNEANVSLLKSFDPSNSHFLETFAQENDDKLTPSQRLIFTVTTDAAYHPGRSAPTIVPLTVTIHEENPLESKNDLTRQKKSIQESFKTCQPGWLCNRCLQTPMYGSYYKCNLVCPDCVADIICGGDVERVEEVTINIHAKRNSPTPLSRIQVTQQRIPRIIHQTWFEDITIESYPQLYRLQNTWRASGWEYRFYTDSTARQYIQDNYPLRFVAVFDSLVPGAYKADFFRYLVLYKDGGIYVDVDVMLNANLDSFITPDLAFFAPIDAVGSYADEHFCVWNGLLGSAPAHPILTSVIEWMVNLVSNRGDMYDMERAVCQFSGGKHNVENWKLRAEPSLLLSGPCALGLAVNNVMGNEPLAKFNAGLIKRNGSKQKHAMSNNSNDLIGDVMILVVSCLFTITTAVSVALSQLEFTEMLVPLGRQTRSWSFSL